MNFYSHCHFTETVYMLMNKALDDTSSSHKRFLLPQENENLLFNMGGRKNLCLIRKAQDWSHLLPVSGHPRGGSPLSCALHPPAIPGAPDGKGSHEPRSPCHTWQSLPPLPNAICRGWSEGTQNIKCHLTNAICARNWKIFISKDFFVY